MFLRDSASLASIWIDISVILDRLYYNIVNNGSQSTEVGLTHIFTALRHCEGNGLIQTFSNLKRPLFCVQLSN